MGTAIKAPPAIRSPAQNTRSFRSTDRRLWQDRRRMELLRLEKVSKSFGGVHALREVSFQLRSGEVHGLVGENGAGKSTLVKIVTGAHAPDSGTLTVLGREMRRLDPLLARSLGIAPIYQQPALFPDLSVAENLALAVEPPHAWRRIDWNARRLRAIELLASVQADVDPEAAASTLGMADQQLVEIARALGADARILLMDEPTAALSERETARLFELIGELRGRGVGILYISHRLEELSRLADRVTVLRDGAVVATLPVVEVTRDQLVRHMAGREVSAVFPKRSVPRGELLLETRGLGGRDAGIHGIDLRLHKGEILGLAGLVGAGRTELARVLFGLLPADEGEIFLRGRDVSITSPGEALAMGIAYVPEDRRRHGVIAEMAIAPNVTLGILRRLTRGGLIDFGRERSLAEEFRERLGIKTPSVDQAVSTLSGGNQQKVALARRLATRPQVLILDEPTQGVDVGAKAEIHRLMVELAEQGMGILMISSELPEVLGMSDTIAVMHRGRINGVLERDRATAEGVLRLALGHRDEANAALAPAATHQSAPPPATARSRRETSLGLALVALMGLLAFRAPAFFSAANLVDVLTGSAPALVAAVGMTLVILARQIDISIGSQFAICGVVAGLLAKAGLPTALAGAGAVVAGGLMGTVNGLLVGRLGLPSIVVTLATMVVLREALRWTTEGIWVQDLPSGFQWFGLGQDVGRAVIVAVALAVFAVAAWAARRLGGGRSVYATGSDAEAARLLGIQPHRVVIAVFVTMGALTGLAATVTAIQFIDVQTNAGIGLELKVIAAVVVGGTAISGGRGSLFGTLLGVTLLGLLGPALTFLGTQAYWDRAIQGAIILVAVAADALERRRER
jgi:rhamnose transport system ATP-binding protein